MQTPFLTDSEIAEICAPLKVPAYQVKFLKRLGLIVNRKPNGKPLVARGEFERVLVGRAPEPAQGAGSAQLNTTALFKLFQGGKRGPQAQGR